MRELADLAEKPIHTQSQARELWHAANRIIHDVQARLPFEEWEMLAQFSIVALAALDYWRELF